MTGRRAGSGRGTAGGPWRRGGTAAFMLLGLLAVPVGFFAVPAVADELRFLTWADYIAPEVVAKFERETGHTLIVDTFMTVGELRDKLKPGAPVRYDIAHPADYDVPMLAQSGVLEPINAQELPGYANLLDGWRSAPYDRRNEWSVPFHWGTTSIVVDTAVYKGDIDTYRLLFDPPPELKDKVGFLIGAEETLRMALLYMGLPQCTSDRAVLDRAMALVRPLLHPGRVYDISSVLDTLTSGRVAVAVAWNGDALRARAARPTLRYAYPKEGIIVWSDALVVMKGTPHKAAALQFINFMLQPENAALQSNFSRYANAIRGSDTWMDPDLLDAPEVVLPSHVQVRFFRSCNSEQLGLYGEIWDPVLQSVQKTPPKP